MVNRVFNTINVFDESPAGKKSKTGLNRLAGSTYDREAWVTLIVRLATRASAGLQAEDGEKQIDEKALAKGEDLSVAMGDQIRDKLWRYILEDFRGRMPIAIFWLNEEWFNDKMEQKMHELQRSKDDNFHPPKQYYEKWVLKVFDSIEPYLDVKEQKILIRFLSEIPVVSEGLLGSVKNLARDPERVDLTIKSIV